MERAGPCTHGSVDKATTLTNALGTGWGGWLCTVPASVICRSTPSAGRCFLEQRVMSTEALCLCDVRSEVREYVTSVCMLETIGMNGSAVWV